MSYATNDIRNICLLGHGGSGKTSIAENMLFSTGAIDRQGKVPDGNTVCDYDAEETKRQISIATSIAPIEFGGKKINVFGQSHLDAIAEEHGLPILARLPIDPAVAEAYDNGLMETVNTDALTEAIEAVKAAE